MALIARRRRIRISLYASVNRVGRRFIVRMAVRATERVVIRRVQMTIRAGGPDVGVRSGVDREPGVIERRSGPVGGVVTGGARGRKSRRHVIWIRRPGPIRLVARIAVGGNGGVVVGNVAGCARRGDMRPGQRERGVRMVERGSGPVGGAVAQRAIQRKSRRYVIWIRGLVVLGEMTSVTGGWEGRVIVVHVAGRAGRRDMSSRQRERRLRMVECGAGPIDGAVTERAVGGERGLDVIRSGGLVVIRQVAAHASERRCRVTGADVALRARQRGVRSGERKHRIVIERRGQPGGRVVTLGAVGGKTRCNMIRVGGALQVRLVTPDAGGRRGGEVSAHMACRARSGRMRARQREIRNQRVIERRVEPGMHVVAHRAVRRELLMRRILRRQKFLAVAVDAGRAHSHENAAGRAFMAAFAGRRRVRAEQRKTVGMLASAHLRGRRPTLHRVALLAAGAHLRAMQIRVAGGAVVRSFLEDWIGMALLTGNVGMHPAQRVAGLRVVIELRVRPNGLPRRGGMARLAGGRKRTVRIFRAILGAGRGQENER